MLLLVTISLGGVWYGGREASRQRHLIVTSRQVGAVVHEVRVVGTGRGCYPKVRFEYRVGSQYYVAYDVFPFRKTGSAAWANGLADSPDYQRRFPMQVLAG